METLVSPDEPEPSGVLSQYTLPLIMTVYLLACNSRTTEPEISSQSIDCRLTPSKAIVVTPRPKKPPKHKINLITG